MPSAVGLVDEQVAAVGVGVGVEGDDLDAGVARLVERVAEAVGVVGGDRRARRRPAGSAVLMKRHLAVGRPVGRADLAKVPPNSSTASSPPASEVSK